MRCVGVRGGLGGHVNVSYQSKSDRFTTPENQASRLSLIPSTPLNKGLVIDFLGIFFLFLEKGPSFRPHLPSNRLLVCLLVLPLFSRLISSIYTLVALARYIDRMQSTEWREAFSIVT